MARYTDDSKDRVRDAADLVEIVSARGTELRRAGPNSYSGLCPFHDERTPSFSVDPHAKVYYCFGCQARGDVFTFVQETEGVDFVGAMELLADRYGVELAHEGGEDPREAERRRRRARILELLSRTCGYYERVLWDTGEAARARDYLAGRGLATELLREFRVGYAQSAWDQVLTRSLRAGFSEAELREAGLSQRSRETGRPYDRFRERIMFPLADVRGRVLGFGARAMRDNQQPKYVNTADSDTYHKGRELYGADLARVPAARAGRVIVCEGYTDVIALHQAGLRETVGLMGTAMTDEQVGALARMASTVLLALDADSAGQEAMLRAAEVAARARLELRVVALPAGSDPADLVARDGAQAVHDAVAASVPFVRFRVQRVLDAGDDSSPEGRDRMLEQLRPVFATLPTGAMREELMRVVSGRLGLREGVTEGLLGGVRQAPRAATRTPAARTAPQRRPLDRREQTERTFLALCVALPKAGREALGALDLHEHFTSDLTRRAAAHLLEHIDAPSSGADGDEELAELLTELSMRAARETAHPQALEVENLQLELARIDRTIQTARAEGRTAVAQLGAERSAVKQALDRAYDRVLVRPGDGCDTRGCPGACSSGRAPGETPAGPRGRARAAERRLRHPRAPGLKSRHPETTHQVVELCRGRRPCAHAAIWGSSIGRAFGC